MDLLLALEKGGADVIELGVPFTDPTADGPVIENCHEQALAQGVGLKETIEYVKRARAKGLTKPVILMGAWRRLVFLSSAGVEGERTTAELASGDVVRGTQ